MVDDIEFTDLVDQQFNIDGPHDADTIVTALWAAGRLLRYVAHATLPGTRHLPYGPQIYRAVGALDSLLATTVQVTEQLGDAAGALADDPTLFDDRRDPRHPAARTAIELASTLLDEAAPALGQASRPLRTAHTLAGRLGHD